jgi:VWFA-related protein
MRESPGRRPRYTKSMLDWRLIPAIALLSAQVTATGLARAQEPAEPQQQPSTINVRSTLVLVPALVRTKSGTLVYTLTAKDFTLTDNGAEQKLTLEDDAGGQPLALLVVVETGGAGGRQLDTYRTLPTMLDGLIGGVPHKVGVVAFDSHPELVQKFTPQMERVGIALNNLEPGDPKAATVDALAFAVNILRAQPPMYRRAILLLSETVDHGSTTSLAEALRAVSDTNTVIYSAAFSSTRSDAKNEAGKIFQPETPGPPTGCMGKDPDADPNISENEVAKAFDCLSLLAPPLRVAKIAILAGISSLRKNTPESVAHLTGGEYYKFTNVKSLEQDLATISNHIPNRYMLSFHPQSPEPGIHALELSLKDYPDLKVTARSSYWLDQESTGKP